MSPATAHDESRRSGVQASVAGRVGWLTLDRPAALNALTLEMIDALAAGLVAHERDAAVEAIVVRSEVERAFCVGGDMKRLHELVLRAEYDKVDEFFHREYALNLAIANCTKPWISLIDGIAMGGGLGISVHGSHRVLTENARVAMPEVRIGFFPDVGASHFLPRLPGNAGTWLALTGLSLAGFEGVQAGLGTHAVPRERLDALVRDLVEGDADIDAVLDGASVPADDADFAARLSAREAWFAAVDPVRIEGDLKRAARADGDGAGHDEDATMLLEAMRSASPFSIDTALVLMRGSLERTLDENLLREFSAMREAVRHPDFIEGIRALLVDKDHAPRWVR